MLVSVTRKLCPLLSMAILAIGCGKKITDSGVNLQSNIENQDPSPTITLTVDNTKATQEDYLIPRSAHFRLPEFLQIKEGSSVGKRAEIFYNLNPENPDDYNFRCTYLPDGPSQFKVSRCFGGDNSDWGDVEDVLHGEDLILDPNSNIRLRLKGLNTSPIIFEAVHIVTNWL